MILEVFSILNDSMILFPYCLDGKKRKKLKEIDGGQGEEVGGAISAAVSPPPLAQT